MINKVGNVVVLTGEDMKILDLLEKPDGSAIMQVDLSQEEVRMLIEYALVGLLQEAIEDGRLERIPCDGDVEEEK